jgi:hypothetical protein
VTLDSPALRAASEALDKAAWVRLRRGLGAISAFLRLSAEFRQTLLGFDAACGGHEATDGTLRELLMNG